jgi:hypothetical protein
MSQLTLGALLLQSDSSYWDAMKHRHLVLAYVITWAFQLGYAGWILYRWRRAGR